MQFDFYLNNTEEFNLGISSAHGEDQNGNDIWIFTIGFLFFNIDIIKPLNQ